MLTFNIDHLLLGCSEEYIELKRDSFNEHYLIEKYTHKKIFDSLTDYKEYPTYKYLNSQKYTKDKDSITKMIKLAEVELKISDSDIYNKIKKESTDEIFSLTNNVNTPEINSNVKMIDSVSELYDDDDDILYPLINTDRMSNIMKIERNCVVYTEDASLPLFNFDLFQNHIFNVHTTNGVSQYSYNYLYNLNDKYKVDEGFKFVDAFQMIGPFLTSIIKLYNEPNTAFNRRTILYIKEKFDYLFLHILDKAFWKMLHFNPDIKLIIEDDSDINYENLYKSFSYDFSDVNKDLLNLFEFRYLYSKFYNLLINEYGNMNDAKLKSEIRKIYANFQPLMFRTDIPYFIPPKAKFGIG